MKIRPACRSEYNRGLAERRKYPLHTGEYKLDECDSHPRRLLELIQELSGIRYSQDLRSYCTHQDVNERLRRAPDGLSYLMAYKLLPAIEALSGDGVPELHIAQRMPTFVREGLRITDALQEVADEYRFWGVKEEVQRISMGYGSGLTSPCQAILRLIDSGKALKAYAGPLPPHHPRPTKLCNV